MSKTWKRNLPVPFFSQRDNEYQWRLKATENQYLSNLSDIEVENLSPSEKEIYSKMNNGIVFNKGDVITDDLGNDVATQAMKDISCNVTCLAMLLSHLGLIKFSEHTDKETVPDKIMKSTFENMDNYMKYLKTANMSNYPLTGYDCVLSIDVLESIAKDFGCRFSYVSLNYTLDDVKDEIAAGFPVIVSCGIIRPSSEYVKDTYPEGHTYRKQLTEDSTWPYRGHYIVIRGFTENGDVIINDPWGKATNDLGEIPKVKINEKDEERWGWYTTNKDNGKNDGENVVIPLEDFKQQMKNGETFHSALVLYDRRWTFPFAGYELDWEVKNDVFLPTEESMHMQYLLEASRVHFPITNVLTPHMGIHLGSKKGTDILSIGSGQIIAAKIRLKEGEDVTNGSNCMILVKHTIRLAGHKTDALKTFYVLYMHLNPNHDLNKYSFYNELQKRSMSLETNTELQKSEMKNKIRLLEVGESVLLNDIGIYLEVAKGDIIGSVGTKGATDNDTRSALHWEVFSEKNIVEGVDDFTAVLDMTGIKNPFDRAEVVRTIKERIFKDYIDNLKHYEHDGVSSVEVEKFFGHILSHGIRKLVVSGMALWSKDIDWANYLTEQKSTSHGEKTEEEYTDNFIVPYLWWNKNITNALEGFTGKKAYFYHPIHFLHWLMINDERLYAEICPNQHDREIAAQK